MLAGVARCLAQENVSVASMLQKDVGEDGRVQMIIITHEAQEQAIQAALSCLDQTQCKLENLIRVES